MATLIFITYALFYYIRKESIRALDTPLRPFTFFYFYIDDALSAPYRQRYHLYGHCRAAKASHFTAAKFSPSVWLFAESDAGLYALKKFLVEMAPIGLPRRPGGTPPDGSEASKTYTPTCFLEFSFAKQSRFSTARVPVIEARRLMRG